MEIPPSRFLSAHTVISLFIIYNIMCYTSLYLFLNMLLYICFTIIIVCCIITEMSPFAGQIKEFRFWFWSSDLAMRPTGIYTCWLLFCFSLFRKIASSAAHPSPQNSRKWVLSCILFESWCRATSKMEGCSKLSLITLIYSFCQKQVFLTNWII